MVPSLTVKRIGFLSFSLAHHKSGLIKLEIAHHSILSVWHFLKFASLFFFSELPKQDIFYAVLWGESTWIFGPHQGVWKLAWWSNKVPCDWRGQCYVHCHSLQVGNPTSSSNFETLKTNTFCKCVSSPLSDQGRTSICACGPPERLQPWRFPLLHKLREQKRQWVGM